MTSFLTDGDGAAAYIGSGAGVENIEVIRTVVVVVSKACKVRVDFGCNVLLGVFDRDGEVAVAVLVLVVGVERYGRAGQDGVSAEELFGPYGD